jgi:hypothetical protein
VGLVGYGAKRTRNVKLNKFEDKYWELSFLGVRATMISLRNYIVSMSGIRHYLKNNIKTFMGEKRSRNS